MKTKTQRTLILLTNNNFEKNISPKIVFCFQWHKLVPSPAFKQKNQCSLTCSARYINPSSQVSVFCATLWSCCHVAHLLKDRAWRHARYTSAQWRQWKTVGASLPNEGESQEPGRSFWPVESHLFPNGTAETQSVKMQKLSILWLFFPLSFTFFLSLYLLPAGIHSLFYGWRTLMQRLSFSDAVDLLSLWDVYHHLSQHGYSSVRYAKKKFQVFTHYHF